MADPLAAGTNQLRSMYGEDMFQQASQLAGLIKSYRAQAKAQQKTETLAPYTQALEGAANQWRSATDDEGRANASALANLTRENMLRGGISPADIDQRYWGSDPTRGFQTTSGFEAPVTGYEGLKRTQAIDALRQSVLDKLTQRQTEADLSGIDPFTGEKTWGRQYQEQQLALAAMKGAGGGGGGGGGLTAYQQYQISAKEAADLAAEKQGLGQQLMSGKLTRDNAIDIILKNYSAGVVSYNKANELLGAVDVFAPAPAAPVAGASDNPLSYHVYDENKETDPWTGFSIG